MEPVTFITEPLLHPDFVQFESFVPILERLRNDFDVAVAAPAITPQVRVALEQHGIRSIGGGVWFPRIRRSRDEIPSYVISWTRDTLWGGNRRTIERVLAGRDGLRVNVSMTVACDADIWKIQSRPLGLALEAIRASTRLSIRAGIAMVQPVVGPLDVRHLRQIATRSRLRYTNSRHVGDWFEAHRISVEGVIPSYYRPVYRPSTGTPSRDYLLVYVGKETDATALRLLLDTGIPVRLFGSKSPGWVMSMVRPERYGNVRVIGRCTDEELRELYTNARFTAFPFTEESFGLVPVESMACGTPVLTYGIQGPADTVLDGKTGWFVRSPEEFARRASELWKQGYGSEMPGQCLARAQVYHLDAVVALWRRLIWDALRSRDDRSPAADGRTVSAPTPDGAPKTSSGPAGLSRDDLAPEPSASPSVVDWEGDPGHAPVEASPRLSKSRIKDATAEP